jgi:hypothetical protein
MIYEQQFWKSFIPIKPYNYLTDGNYLDEHVKSEFTSIIRKIVEVIFNHHSDKLLSE